MSSCIPLPLPLQLDPDNHKTIVEIQEEAARVKLNGVVKRKVEDSASSDEEEDDEAISNGEAEDDGVVIADGMVVDEEEEPPEITKERSSVYKPMEPTSDIEALRAKLYARMKELRQKSGPKRAENGGSSKDDLLEERRQQRAAMRERRRKEKRERIRREEEEKRAKGKGKERQQQTGPARPVRSILASSFDIFINKFLRHNSSCPMSRETHWVILTRSTRTSPSPP